MFGKKREPEKVTRIDNPALFAVLDATGALTVNVFPQQIKSAGIAGIMLADIAVHLARALAASKLEASESDALGRTWNQQTRLERVTAGLTPDTAPQLSGKYSGK